MSAQVLIAIPAYNEGAFIEQCIRRVSAFAALDHILIINDGSTDQTGDLAHAAGVRVVEHTRNQGKGAAILTALSFACRNHFQWILFMDGDGQHPAASIPEFLQQIARDHADVLLGNRQNRKRRMPVHRQLSNGITSLIISWCAGGTRIHDSQCGMRALRLSALKDLTLYEHGFQLESEMLIKLGRVGARFDEIGIETVYGGEKSSIRLVADTLEFILLILKSLLW